MSLGEQEQVSIDARNRATSGTSEVLTKYFGNEMGPSQMDIVSGLLVNHFEEQSRKSGPSEHRDNNSLHSEHAEACAEITGDFLRILKSEGILRGL